MIDLALLKILADGKFHSGTALGVQLGLSRSAVWKQMKLLEEYHVDIYSVRGRGYRLPNGLDLLDVDKIRDGLSRNAKEAIQHIELKTFTDSTNLMALRNINECRQGALYLTEHQHAGRGRRGRSWVGPFATNLYFSLMWRFSGGAAALEGLSLVVGLSVVQALADVGISGLALKWPNDLLFNGRKLAGILLEMQGDASGEVSVVIGVGINVKMSKNSNLTDAIDQPWVDLAEIVDKPVDRNKLMSVIVERLIDNLQLFSNNGFSAFIEQWHAVHAFQDEYVKLLGPSSEIEGVCRGVNEQGALLLERYGKVEAHHGGEISVRLQ